MSQSLIFIYFIYGLAFFAMGLALLLETGRSPALAEAKSLRFLAAFGLIHGAHEWLESYLLQSQAAGTLSAPWLTWLRLCLLISSFIALFVYAYLTLRIASPKYQGRRLLHFDRLAVYEVLIISCTVLTYQTRPADWPTLLDGLSRYALAIPAAALAGLALYAQGRQFRQQGRALLTGPLIVSAFAFAVYALAQAFVHPIDAFPARYINQLTFLAVTGVPVQAVRTLAAVTITVGLLRARQLVEEERQGQLEAAHRASLAAMEERDTLRRELLEHIVRSQEEERARIARELHDEIAQLLSGFSLELAALKTIVRRPDTNRIVDRLQGLARQMSQSLYRLVRDLRPAQLDDLGLVPALKSWIEQDCRSQGLDVEFDVRGTPERLIPSVETAVFRVAQEALNNASRHSGVKQATVVLQYGADRVSICISDNGRGFDPSEQFRPPRGWGLVGMRERVESLQGQFTLQSAPGKGTRVEVMIPLEDGAGKEVEHGSD